MKQENIPQISGSLRKNMILVPEEINKVSGIRIFGKLIKSILFSTDIAIIRNCNANAVIAVYPFTPQPAITQSIIMASDVPVFCGVGGGTTMGKRVVNLATHAEFQGAIGVVLNAPTVNELIKSVANKIDIPVIVTVVSEHTDLASRIKSGTTIFNVSGAAKTPYIVEEIRKQYPDFPIIATGGPTNQTIDDVINAGANAITYTPPSSADIFKKIMINYRNEL
ncbi:MAG: hydrolase [Oscillospiraceae bacterium]